MPHQQPMYRGGQHMILQNHLKWPCHFFLYNRSILLQYQAIVFSRQFRYYLKLEVFHFCYNLLFLAHRSSHYFVLDTVPFLECFVMHSLAFCLDFFTPIVSCFSNFFVMLLLGLHPHFSPQTPLVKLHASYYYFAVVSLIQTYNSITQNINQSYPFHH